MANAFEEDVLDMREELEDSFDLDELEEKLQNELTLDLEEISFLEQEKEKIGNPDALGNVIKNVVWEQVCNQIGVKAGEDFIKENRGFTLDLRDSAHMQTTENFAQGKIATHNSEIDYQQRYDDWQANFQKDESGNIITHTTRMGTEEANLVKEARIPFDCGRPTGSSKNNTDVDHIVSAAEIIRDPAANAHLTKEEQISFANSDVNLHEMDSSLNRSKGDKSVSDWLDNPNSKGQKPSEIFDISDEYDKELREKDKKARQEYDKVKREGEQKSIKAGKKSQKQEAFRIGGMALRSIVMQMLADLVREIIAKLVEWLKSANKKISLLCSKIKEAITDFITNIKKHVINAGNTLVVTIATSIFGPVIRTIKKVWMMLKQGWQSLKNAVNYITSPENKNRPFDILILEVGKILIAGLSGAGALVLGEVIEKGLLAIPGLGVIFAFEIPLFGSLANILGIFFGAIVSGLVGAIALNLVDKVIANKKKQQLQVKVINKKNIAVKAATALAWVKLGKAYGSVKNITEETITSLQQSEQKERESFNKTEEALKNLESLLRR